MINRYIKGIGMLVGMIFGAGVFVLPYVTLRAGIFWSIINFIIVFSILVYLHILYSEVAYFTEGRHRFTGYTEKYLGSGAKKLAFITTIASYYGTFLIYAILGGIFISNIFSISPVMATILFFIICSLFAVINSVKMGVINFYLTIPLLGLIVYLLFVSIPLVNFSNFQIMGQDWFLPFGTWLFALAGFSIIPEVREIFSGAPLKKFKKTIKIGMFLSAALFVFFVISVLGVGGFSTTPDALTGLKNILGPGAFIIGSIIGLLAVSNSYIALAVDGKNIFKYDYKINQFLSWLLAVAPAIVLFFLGINDFVRILDITGVLGMGILGIFIMKMSKSLREKLGKREEFAPFNKFLEFIVLFIVLAGVVYEFWRII